MIVQRRNNEFIGISAAQIDTLHEVFLYGEGFMQLRDEHGHGSVQFVLYTNVAFIITGLSRVFGFASPKDEKCAY
jgi:hypothetical protein